MLPNITKNKPIEEEEAPKVKEKSEEDRAQEASDRIKAANAEKEAAVKKVSDKEASNAAADTKTAHREGRILYVTAKKENASMTIRAGGKEIVGHRDKSKQYILFSVPESVEENFKAHKLVKSGRIIKADK